MKRCIIQLKYMLVLVGSGPSKQPVIDVIEMQ